MPNSRLVFRLHAVQRMFERSISDVDVRKVLVDGVMIEDYPDDQPYPSFLVLAWVNGRPLHVVAAGQRRRSSDNHHHGVRARCR